MFKERKNVCLIPASDKWQKDWSFLYQIENWEKGIKKHIYAERKRFLRDKCTYFSVNSTKVVQYNKWF